MLPSAIITFDHNILVYLPNIFDKSATFPATQIVFPKLLKRHNSSLIVLFRSIVCRSIVCRSSRKKHRVVNRSTDSRLVRVFGCSFGVCLQPYASYISVFQPQAIEEIILETAGNTY